MKKRKYAVSGILCMAILLIYPLYAGIYTRLGDDDEFPGGPVGECPKEDLSDDVLLVDESRCDLFYKCHWGFPVLQSCPNDLLFNAQTYICDFPEDVDCYSSKFEFNQ